MAIFFLVVYALPTLAQPQKVFTLNDISDLIKNGVTPNRIAQLVEEHGVGFELDDRALRRLKQDGANDTVLSAVRKMSARYAEERQRIRQQEEETRRKREEEAKRRADEQKRQQAKGAQEVAKKSEEAKRKAQEEARQKSQRPTLGSAEGVASVRNVTSTEQGKFPESWLTIRNRRCARSASKSSIPGAGRMSITRVGTTPEGPLIIS